MAFTLEKKMGRLLVVTLRAPNSVADVEALQAQLRQAIQELGQQAIILTDVTQVRLIAPDLAEAYVKLMRTDNSLVLRAGLLVQAEGSFGMQLYRMLKDAANPLRQAFRTTAELEAWLSEVMTPDEKADLHAYCKLAPK